jgi:hypothetical protein
LALLLEDELSDLFVRAETLRRAVEVPGFDTVFCDLLLLPVLPVMVRLVVEFVFLRSTVVVLRSVRLLSFAILA